MTYKGYTLKEEYHTGRNSETLHVVIARPDGSEIRVNTDWDDRDFSEIVDEDIEMCKMDDENEARREAIANGLHPNFL